MGKIDIDKYFKERLNSHTEDLDTDAIWRNLNLDEKKRNRGFIFWLVGSIGVMASIFAIYFITPLSKQTNVEQGVTTAPMEQVVIADKDEKIDISEVEKDIVSTHTEISEEPKRRKEDNTSLAGSLVFDNKLVRSQPSYYASNQSLTSKKYNESSENEESKTLSSLDETDSAPSKIQTNIISSQVNNSTPKTPNNSSPQLLAPLALLNMSMLEYDYLSKMDLTIDSDLSIDPLVIEESRSIELDVYSSYSIADRRLESILVDGEDGFLKNKKSSETTLDAVSVGAALRHKIGIGFYAKIGVEALSITERFDHVIESTETVMIAPNIRGTRPVRSTWINYNHHRFLNFPLSLGYEQSIGPWSYFIESGLHLNALYRFSGLQLDVEGNVTDEDLTEADNSLRHSYVLSAGIDYKLTSISSLYLQPRFQSTFSSNKLSSEVSGMLFSQNYNLYGVQLGFRYSMNSRKP